MRWSATLAALVVSSSLPASAAPPARAGAQPPVRDFPCPGCLLHVPARAPDGPRPLVVALHGDGGAMLPVLRAWQSACDEVGAILLVPRCPRELGCATQSYWQWLVGRGHDEAWLGGLVDAVAARHPIDPARIYATGYSGGATYLGWYAPRHPTRFAAVAHVAGGSPWGGACPACKVPVLFVIGSTDPMIEPYTAPLRRYYEACGGHEVVWQILPGVTHEGILGVLQGGRARDIMSWLMARPASCAAGGAPDAGDAGALDAGPGDAGALDVGPPEAGPPGAVDAGPPEAPSPPLRVRPQAGCACRSSRDPAWGAGPFCLLAALAAARRRGRRRWAGDAGCHPAVNDGAIRRPSR